ncbi:MAG: L,D-transpeptidase family protein [Chitinophagales bacterium]|nr:L,D-transpeptidase family protein [Chitinophagales bacterium]
MNRFFLHLNILLFVSVVLLQCKTAKTKDNVDTIINSEEVSDEDFNKQISVLIKSEIEILANNKVDSANFTSLQTILHNTYKSTNFQPIWVNKHILNENGKSFFYFLANAELHALIKEKYNYATIKQLKDSLEHNLPSIQFQLIKNLDIELTKAFLQIALHIDKGIYNEQKKSINTNFFEKEDNYINLLASIKAGKNPEKVLEQLEPQHPMYKRFIAAVYKFVSKNNISPQKISIRNYKTDSIGAINDAKLALTYHHYLHDTMLNNNVAYLSALKAFQKDQGYNPDGVVGNMTARALERDNSQKFRLLLINIDRWRSKKNDIKIEQKYVWVNLPSYKLNIIRNDSLLLQKNVVIGKSGGRTESPEIISAINQIVVWPTWSVPQSIIKNEMKSFKGYIVSKKNGYTSVVQPPGLNNSLGAVKILFPNKHSVYIHDTPSKYLFKSDYRSHSHGCIRCQDPFEVAGMLLNMDNSAMDYDSLIRLKEKKIATKNISLKNPIPVYLQYFTAEADWNENLKFYADTYKNDSIIIATIFGEIDNTTKQTTIQKIKTDSIINTPNLQQKKDTTILKQLDSLPKKEEEIILLKKDSLEKSTTEPF